MSKQHLSCFLYGPGDARFELHDDPLIERPQDVLVEIAYTGVCGSDVHFWVHGGISPHMVTTPLIMGHEASGTVAAVGSSVTSLSVGDRVAVEPGNPCLRCVWCKSGKYHLCAEMRFAACPPTVHGTLTKFYKTTESFCYKLPEELSLQEAVLIEPLSVAVHAVRLAKITPADEVVVFGAGPVGLLCGAVAKAFGATKVIGVDIVDQRLSFASRYGVSGTYKPDSALDTESNARRLAETHSLEGGGADIVIDASGVQASMQTGIHVLKKGGTYVQAGMGKAIAEIPIMAVCAKEIKLQGSFRYGAGDYDLALKLVREGKVSVKELITDVVSFDQATAAWEKTRRGEGIKILIKGNRENADTRLESAKNC